MLELLLFLLLGCILGIITGLIPGIHPNTVVLLIPFILAAFPQTSLLYMIILIIAMSVTNSITDFIPSILLGAPDPSVALSVLPGHYLLMQGNAYKAIKLTVIGGVLSVIVITILSPLFVATLPFIYTVIKQWMAYILIIALSAIVIISKKYLLTLSIITLAGLLGIASTYLPLFADLNNMTLFPLLAGLFAFPMLFTQIRHKTIIPKQYINKNINLINKDSVFSAIAGSLAGLFSGLLPGVGASQAAILTSPDAGQKNPDSFLVRIGAITTSNIILSFMALWLISRPRSGAAVAVQQLITGTINFGMNEFLLIIPVVLVSAAIAAFSTMFLACFIIKHIPKINYTKLSIIVLIMIHALVFMLTGPLGLLLAWFAAVLGMLALRFGVLRTSLMACLIIPTILFYQGVFI